MPRPPNTGNRAVPHQHWLDASGLPGNFHREDGPAVINQHNRSWVVDGLYIMTVFNGGPRSSAATVLHYYPGEADGH